MADNGSNSHVINNGGALMIASGGFLVLGRNGDSTANGGVALDYDGTFVLANADDELVLFDLGLNEMDRVEWDGGPAFPDPNGASMALINPFADNNVGGNWLTSTAAFGDGDFGTPGGCNTDVGQKCSVPEPSLLALFGFGFVGLGGTGLVRRRWSAAV